MSSQAAALSGGAGVFVWARGGRGRGETPGGRGKLELEIRASRELLDVAFQWDRFVGLFPVFDKEPSLIKYCVILVLPYKDMGHGLKPDDICILIMYSTTNLLNWITLIKSSLIFRIEIFLSRDCSSVKSRGCKRYSRTIRYLLVLETKVIQKFTKISQSRRRPLLGLISRRPLW